MLKVYYRILKISLISMLSDGGKTFLWVGELVAVAFVSFLPWFVLIKSNPSLSISETSGIMMYYFLMFLAWFVIGGAFRWGIINPIRKGELSIRLVQPIFPFVGSIIGEQSWKLFNLIVSLPIFILVYFLLDGGKYIETANLVYFIPSVIIGAINFGLIELIVGYSTFWLNRADGVVFFSEMLSYAFGGSIAPIFLLPALMQKIIVFTPFRYTFGFSIEVIQGFIDVSEIQKGLVYGLIWMFLLWVISKLMYHKGLKHYESAGI